MLALYGDMLAPCSNILALRSKKLALWSNMLAFRFQEYMLVLGWPVWPYAVPV